MKQSSTIFLQVVVTLVGLVVLFLMARFPLTEGRAENLDLISIYFNPFILYAYVASIPFFIALYKTFKLLGYIGQNNAFSLYSVMALKSIRYCALVLIVLIIVAGMIIRIFHNKDDDPAGFLALCIAIAFVSLIIATTAAVLQKIFQNGVDLKSENEKLYEQSKK